jgi:hypothetical protein
MCQFTVQILPDPDPTDPENITSVHGRGIYVMKMVMDEVRFEGGGAVIHMRKSATEALAEQAVVGQYDFSRSIDKTRTPAQDTKSRKTKRLKKRKSAVCEYFFIGRDNLVAAASPPRYFVS